MRKEAKERLRPEEYVDFCRLQYYAVLVPGAGGSPLARLSSFGSTWVSQRLQSDPSTHHIPLSIDFEYNRNDAEVLQSVESPGCCADQEEHCQ